MEVGSLTTQVPAALQQRVREAIAQNAAARRAYAADPDSPLTNAAREAAITESRNVRALLSEWNVPDDDN